MLDDVYARVEAEPRGAPAVSRAPCAAGRPARAAPSAAASRCRGRRGRPSARRPAVADAKPVRLGGREALARGGKDLVDLAALAVRDEVAHMTAAHGAVHHGEVALGDHVVHVPAHVTEGVAQPQRGGVVAGRPGRPGRRRLVDRLAVDRLGVDERVEASRVPSRMISRLRRAIAFTASGSEAEDPLSVGVAVVVMGPMVAAGTATASGRHPDLFPPRLVDMLGRVTATAPLPLDVSASSRLSIARSKPPPAGPERSWC